MSDILSRAKAHFRDKLAAPLKFIEISEWPDEEGQPSKIYFRSSMTLQQQQEILSLNNQDKLAEALVATLIAKALDENGKPIFRQVHRTELLRNVDSDLISDILRRMNEEAEELSEDEILGN